MDEPRAPTQAERIVVKFGGQSALARALTETDPCRKRWQPSTVQQWEKYGYIPPRHWERVFRAARAVGAPLEPMDLIAHLVELLGRQQDDAAPSDREKETA